MSSDALDSPIALAVMTKAQKVFANPETFLSFPLTPVAYDIADLAFAGGGALSRELVLKLAEFSRVVNLVPSGTIWPPNEERYLWSVYDDVLATGALAESTLTADEQAAYDQANAVLSVAGADGIREDTPEVKAYRQHKDAWFAARQAYNNQKITAELSGDPNAKERWQVVEEPELRERVNTLERAWIDNGFKVKVEQAQRVFRSLGEKSPAVTWSRWNDAFDLDFDARVDTNELQFVPTGFAPSDIADVGWQKFTLTDSEAEALIAEAPEDIRRRLAADAVNLEIESLSFEYTSVSLTRPWFASDVFTARFWKFRDPAKVLSDGNSPPSGACPAYVAALVLMRSIQVKLKASSTANAAVMARINARPIALGPMALTAPPRVADVGARGELRAVSARVASPPPMARVVAPPRPLTGVAAARVGPPPPAAAIMRGPGMRVAPPIVARMGVPPPAARMVAPPPPAAPPRAAMVSNATLVRMRAANFQRMPMRPGVVVIPPPPPAPGVPAAPVPRETSTDASDVYIMAFICKRLPRCPNPDDTLRWS